MVASALTSREGTRGAIRLVERSRGFTLIELMVALALGVLILLTLTLAFSRNSGNQSELERTTRRMENARFALDILSEDTLHAGYYGEINPDLLTPDFSNPDPCATTPAGLGWATPAGPANPTIPPAIRGIGAAETLGCLSNRLAGTEAVTLRHADTGAPVTIAAIAGGNLYVQTTRCSEDVTQLLAGESSADFTLRNLDCDPVDPNLDSVRRFVQRTYFVAGCNDCTAGDGIPTLKRVELVNGQLRTTSLAEGVENLRVEYGVDTDGDGRPNQFVLAGAITGVAPLVWQNVVAARFHLLVRNTQPTPDYTDPRTYVLGPALSVAPADQFKRSLMTTTARLVNVGGRREL
jgi:type IV pilus assembly protein PilW